MRAATPTKVSQFVHSCLLATLDIFRLVLLLHVERAATYSEMAKPTKRERKFQASGGVKRRLEKGTITHKGKLRQRKKRTAKQPDYPEKTSVPTAVPPKNDFLGDDNLGDLDIEGFFAHATRAADILAGEEEDERASESGDESEGKAQEVKVAPQSSSSSSESSSSSDDSDDEDPEAAEARMKAEMDKMKDADPDFHHFLKENEESLLEFGQGEDAKDDDEVMKEQVTDEPKHSPSGNQVHLTKKVLAALERGTFDSHGVKSLKKLISAYKSACHLADASGSEGGSRPGESGSRYLIDSSAIFDELLLMCLNRCHKEFEYHLLGTDSWEEKKSSDGAEDDAIKGDNKPLNPKTLENTDKWADLRPILVSFFRSTLHVMSEAKEPELLTFILKALSKYLRFLTPFPPVAESTLRSLTSLWSAPLDTSEDYQLVRINAFLRIRQLALTQPFPFIEDCLKKTYLAYAKRAKFGTAATVTSVLPTLTFMGNCLVELYSLDYHSSYQHAFVYIRQLALLLRTAMQKKTPEAMKQVYCWQYVHCLKLWVAVLSASAPEDDGALMRSLVYPLTEVILGTVRFAPSPMRHMPLRFHCVGLLQKLVSSTEIFIPTTSLLLDCLDWKEWYMAPKKSKSGSPGGLQIQYMVKLPKEDTLRTHEQLETGMNEFFLLLNREVELYRYSAGFPEYSIRIVQCLRQFAKETRNSRWRTFAKSSIETCERYSAFAVQARSKLQEAPRDVKRLECLKPVAVKSMRERHEASIQKEQKSLDASRSQSVLKTSDQQKKSADETGTTGGSSKQKTTKKPKNSKETSNWTEADDSVLQQKDSLQEGIDWSDEE